jgi:ABC-type polysaccharide/polyol phosphate export permease
MSEQRLQVSGRRGFVGDLQDAGGDVAGSLRRWRLWTSLAAHDVAARYRGSLLGPWWITVTTAALVGGMGVLYSQIFAMEIRDYIPWLAIGIVLWGFFASVVVEGCDTFIGSQGIIKQTSLPMFTFLARMLTRSLINFGHQLVIVVAVMIWFGQWRSMDPLMALAGFALAVGNLGWMALIGGLISARFRDVPQIVAALMQVLMFMTPVFWKPDAISHGRVLLHGNPFYHMLEAVRRPLLHEPADPTSLAFLAGMLAVGWIVALLLFARTRRRVVHYL